MVIDAVLVLSLEDPRNGCGAQFGHRKERAGTEGLNLSREGPTNVAGAGGEAEGPEGHG